jgi:hypothetical protein
MTAWDSDLVILVADADMEFTLRGLLSRPEALPIRAVTYQIHRHVHRDPGCLLEGHDFLRSFVNRHAHGLILFDRHGSGDEASPRESLERMVENRLSGSGWGDRAAAVALDPELEVWVWSDSPHVDRCLGWQGRLTRLRRWLADQRLWPEGAAKPPAPKLTMRRALREANRGLSASIFRELAGSVSFDRCTDPAFLKLRRLLTNWFPPSSPA